MSGLNARQGWKLDSNSGHSGGAILSAQMFNPNPTADPTSSSSDGYMLKDVRPSIPVKLGPSARSTNGVSAKQMVCNEMYSSGSLHMLFVGTSEFCGCESVSRGCGSHRITSDNGHDVSRSEE